MFPRKRSVLGFAFGFGLTVVLVMVPVLPNSSLHTFWKQTVVSQFDRTSPFSVWGLWGGLGGLQHAVQALTVGLAVLVAFVPRRRTVVEVAALGAAVMIGFQLGLTHWFYLYIPWFFPMLIVAAIASFPSEIGEALKAIEGSGERHPVVAAAV